MYCRRCGNALPENAPDCSCQPVAAPHNKTRLLPVSDPNKTRALVALDQCRNCGFMVFPANTECASCGTWIERTWQQAETKPTRSVPKNRVMAAALAISFVVLSLTALAWYFLPRL